MTIAIVNYGLGNLRSVANAFEALGRPARVTADPRDLREASRIVLPGVGAFSKGMANLEEEGWIDVLEEEVRRKGKPFLGVCLGMQLLATKGTEHGIHEGLNWIPGLVERIAPEDPSIRIPHIGWNDVQFWKRDGMYAEMGEAGTFYFVHSYALRPDAPNVVSGVCSYGVEFAASVEAGNIWATQYHPEKSQKAGLRVLQNFLSRCG